MPQWMNLNRNNRSMIAHLYSVLEENTCLILLPLVGLTAEREGGRPADEMRVGFEIFKILYRLNYGCLQNLDSGLDHGLTTIQALINLFTIIIILLSCRFTLILDKGRTTFEQQYLR